jgi:hypothetical protein
MQPAAAPKIDQRKAEDLLYALIKRIPLHLSEWKKEEEIPQERDRALAVADDPRDFGMALLKLAARMGEIVIEQFNRVPEKNFLAFLDLVGVNLLPPRSARAPLTFALAEKAPTDGFVPQGTKVGVAGVEEDVVFETEEDLVVSRASPLRVYSLSPVQDRYTDLQELLAGAVAEGKTILGDAEPTPAWPLIDHILYLGHDRLLALAATADVPVKITMGLFGGTLGQIDWQYHDGKSWRSVGQSTGAASVSFKVPGIREAKVQGYDAQGNLIARPGYWIRAKTAQPLAADPTQLPTISSIEAEVSVKGVSESPELAFFNKLPLDVTKDLFPFGERPKFNDTLYIAWEEAFSKPGAAITIDAALSPAAAFPRPQTRNIKLAWEHWDGPNKKWSAIAETTQAGVPAEVGPYKFTDTTNAFTKDGKVDFLCPTMEPVAVNQEKNYWLRVRILEGGYGEEAKYETTTEEQLKTTLRSADLADAGLTEAQLSRVASSLKKGGVVDTARYIPATFTPPSLKSFAVEYAYTESARSGFTIVSVNDFIYRDVSHELPIQPFVPTDERRPALYIGFDEARPFQGSPLTLFFQVLQPRYGQQAGAEGAGGGISRPVVVWRYWDGEDWARLAVDDETRNFSQGGRVRFIAPYNLSPRVVFGARVLWLKATLEEGDYARSPRLAGIYLNTVWASHGVTLKDQTLGSSNGEPGQSFTFAKAPVLEGEMIEVREASLPSEAERARIFAAEGEDAIRLAKDAAGNIVEVWVRWHAVDHFNLSAPGDRHYVADRVKGLLLFGDGVRGLIPPPGKDSIRSPLYRSGGGKTGNRAAGLIAELKTTLPFIDAVVNHQASAGGFDQENLEDAMVRGPRLIKSRDRAITKEDFEWLAYQAAGGEIAKARCLPRTRLAAEGLRGNSSGWVTLVVVPETEEPQPLPNEGLIQTVKRYLAQYSLVTLVDQIDVIGPSYVPVAIEATVIPRRIEDAKAVEKRVLENLRAFLHPVKGGSEGQGWEFGKDIYLSEIAAVIQGTEGVDRVQEIVLKTEQGDVRDHVTVPENGLPSSGEHVIRSIGA